jgi:hypothetical protein
MQRPYQAFQSIGCGLPIASLISTHARLDLIPDYMEAEITGKIFLNILRANWHVMSHDGSVHYRLTPKHAARNGS